LFSFEKYLSKKGAKAPFFVLNKSNCLFRCTLSYANLLVLLLYSGNIMAEKDKLSKEVEEQIQSLASDVYIQIEEKLTQLISTVTPKKSVEKFNITQDPAYLALQNDYQTSQNELIENSKCFSEQIHQLKQHTCSLKKQLDDEQSKQVNSDATLKEKDENSATKLAQLAQENIELKQQQLQKQIAANEKALLEQQHVILSLKESLAVSESQTQSLTERLTAVEQQRNDSNNKLQTAEASWKTTDALQTNSLTEQKNQIKALTKQLNTSVTDFDRIQKQYQQQITNLIQESEQKLSQLNGQLQQSQIIEEKQQKIVADQQVQLVGFDEKIKQKIKEEQNYKQTIKQLNNEQSQIQQQLLADKKENDLQRQQQQRDQGISQQQINQLEIKNQELANSLKTEQADIALYQKEVSALKSQVTLAQEGQENILNRFNANREKQEKDNNQVRETIKYLRDENNDMITQNNIQKEEFIEKTSELEHKLTEYRLKFEYAQKQLTQNS